MIRHVARLSDDTDVLVAARRINSTFLRQGLTELKRLDSECEAVLVEDDARRLLSIIVFYRLDGDEPEYYLPVVWTAPKERGRGHYAKLLAWLQEYAKAKGAKRISTDVHHDNVRMIRMMARHWEQSFVRWNLSL